MQLLIDASVYETIITHAQSTYPNECCGFFFGDETNQERHLVLAQPVRNHKDGNQRRRFSIDPKDYLAAEKYAITNNLILLGIYHSHPDHPAKPSQYDLDRAVPYFSYIIVSVTDGQVAATTSWQLNEEGQFEEETISVNYIINRK